ncbi:glycosyltransferase family 2 protein [Clostridiaceae bacterium]|nr:glycosyltransferase family 2 protein [Clostridiaceae bacterium]RKI13855.1 glycosyltransferase family 2 protein [bacterium 1XD21-70]
MAKFSVLIPVYNAEKYLKECIESVLGQNMDDFEVVLVDDGSLDASGEICDEYALHDHRIRVIHQKNQGPLKARIRAFQEAQGKYVIYMDSDDLWDKGLLWKAEEIIRKYDCDIVSFKWRYMDDAGEFIEKEFLQDSLEVIEYSMEKLVAKFLAEETENSLCKRAVRRKCIDAVQMSLLSQIKNIYLGEDMIQSFVMIKDCKNMVYLDAALYFYRMNSQSLTHNITTKSAMDIAKAREYLLEILENTKYNQPQYKKMLKKNFLEHYLTDMVGIADRYPVGELKRTAFEIQKQKLYQDTLKQGIGKELPLKRRVLYYLEKRGWWKSFWIVSKVYKRLAC